MLSRTSQAARRMSDPELSLEAPQIVAGRYCIETRLGRCGLGLQGQRGRRRPRALKRLTENASPRLASLFELEFHTLSSVKHENIVEVYDYASDASGPYYVMELLAGQDLSHERGGTPLSRLSGLVHAMEGGDLGDAPDRIAHHARPTIGRSRHHGRSGPGAGVRHATASARPMRSAARCAST